MGQMLIMKPHLLSSPGVCLALQTADQSVSELNSEVRGGFPS